MRLGHLVKLVNAANALVGQHQSPRLDAHLPARFLREADGKPRRAGRVPPDVDAPGGDLRRRQQHLALPHSGISHHEYVGVVPYGHAGGPRLHVGREGGGSAQQAQEHPGLDEVVPDDGRAEGPDQQIEGEGHPRREGADPVIGVS